MSFLYINVIGKQDKFTTNAYEKSTFSDVYTHFHSFLVNTHKVGMTYTLVNIYFRTWTNWSMFHSQLNFLRFRKFNS